jgi:Protein kinase domain/Sel1 repeat
VDFGLAIPSDAPGTKPVAGTLPYLAPEQLKGAPQDAGSDLWSAGITMYELLTGKLPFWGSNLVHQIVSFPAPQLDASMPLSGDLNRVLKKALAKNKDERYSTASAFMTDLRSLQTALEMSSYPTAEAIERVRLDNDALAKPEPTEIGLNTPERHELPQQPGYLRHLELGFRTPVSGQVAIRSGKLRLKGFGRSVGASLNKLISWVVPLSLIFPLGVLVIPLLLLAAITLWHLSVPILALLVVIKGAELMARHPLCHSCFVPMLHTSRWTRFVKTRTEVLMGYRDCTAALQEGLWQEAAKLLNLHGFEPSSFFSTRLISTPLRYHLDFYECSTCKHHAARMTEDELVDEKWVSGLRFTEAYRGTKPDDVSVVELLRSILPRIGSSIANPLRYSDPVRLSSRAFVVTVAGLVVVLLFGVLNGSNYRGRTINTLRVAQSTSRVTAVKADPVISARNEGLAWYHGSQRPLDRQKAAWCFEFAAKQGDSFSANILGTMYEKAFGLPQNYDKALAWYKQAAQQGDSDAEFNLGRLYENGIGVNKDLPTALHWYGLAAQAGNKDAADRMSHLLPN